LARRLRLVGLVGPGRFSCAGWLDTLKQLIGPLADRDQAINAIFYPLKRLGYGRSVLES